MISKVFTVYDSKAELYLNPFNMSTKGQALRGFEDLVNDGQHNFSKYPADFTLFEIGEWDDQTSMYKMHDAFINLGLAVEFKRD